MKNVEWYAKRAILWEKIALGSSIIAAVMAVTLVVILTIL